MRTYATWLLSARVPWKCECGSECAAATSFHGTHGHIDGLHLHHHRGRSRASHAHLGGRGRSTRVEPRSPLRPRWRHAHTHGGTVHDAAGPRLRRGSRGVKRQRQNAGRHAGAPPCSHQRMQQAVTAAPGGDDGRWQSWRNLRFRQTTASRAEHGRAVPPPARRRLPGAGPRACCGLAIRQTSWGRRCQSAVPQRLHCCRRSTWRGEGVRAN